ncbi:YaaC family protein [Burkholderia pyrrocinia]|uniref:YaaC family protein n=1 Tax=Burkholderia pyrrocinia TaxID=60550 RepID=UPI00215A350F|nr:YaaC family protein [Burkholderia pyrrocinia]UVE65269.1 YaaC family protein [Burkholderia pyrrocinia]
MIITQHRTFRTADIGKYAWDRLAHFQNVEAVTREIMELHHLPERHRANARKQATQLRQCLMQAREYYDAARAVSLATRPVLLYYSAMSLALAEVLMKQSADSRLEKLRELHGCHGLQLSIASSVSPGDDLEVAMAALRAKPQTAPDGSARGTFEVWRRSSRELPIVGRYTQTHATVGMATSGIRALMAGSDVEPDAYPANGLSLLDVLQGLPQMVEILATYGIRPELVRSTCTAIFGTENQDPTLSIIVHPSLPSAMNNFMDLVQFAPRGLHRIDIAEYPNGIHLQIPLADDVPGHFPWSICTDVGNTWFSSRREFLNEFGLIYVALHIAGNFARYYPDKWLAHIDVSSPLALTIDRLTDVVFERVPLLIAGELARSYFVADV